MSADVKGNAEIAADKRAFMAAYERAKATFRTLEGVLCVGFGHKQTGGQYTTDVSIVVTVREKQPVEAIPPAERIPAVFEGYRTDVRPLEAVKASGCNDNKQYATIVGGISIQADRIAALGTLGCIVRRRGDGSRDNVYLLTNQHVLYGEAGNPGRYVYQPFAPPGKGESLGPIQQANYRRSVDATVPDFHGNPVHGSFYLDCAFARINIDSKCWGTTCTHDVIKHATTITELQIKGADTLTDVRSIVDDPDIVIPSGPPGAGGPFVYKVGRSTGRTRGIVRVVNESRQLLYDTPPKQVQADNIFEIEFDATSTPDGKNCLGKPGFSDSGDSGAIIVDDAGRAIGLLCAGPTADTPNAQTFACHIVPVLDKLNLCIPTAGGTSHGSCGATDGSGLGPATTHAAAGDGSLQFAGATADAPPGARARPAPEPPLVTLSEAEQAHLFALRDRFRATPAGPDLHEVFSRVRREIGYLVRNVRPVKVAWHRGEGPAYMAHLINHLKGSTPFMPSRVNGVERGAMLARMADVLAAHGSVPLREGIERYRPLLLPILSSAATVDECIERVAGLGVGGEAASASSLAPTEETSRP